MFKTRIIFCDAVLRKSEKTRYLCAYTTVPIPEAKLERLSWWWRTKRKFYGEKRTADVVPRSYGAPRCDITGYPTYFITINRFFVYFFVRWKFRCDEKMSTWHSKVGRFCARIQCNRKNGDGDLAAAAVAADVLCVTGYDEHSPL